MNLTEFTFWLEGFLEATESRGLTGAEVDSIKKKIIEARKKPANNANGLGYR